jgi:hypothetical protein
LLLALAFGCLGARSLARQAAAQEPAEDVWDDLPMIRAVATGTAAGGPDSTAIGDALHQTFLAAADDGVRLTTNKPLPEPVISALLRRFLKEKHWKAAQLTADFEADNVEYLDIERHNDSDIRYDYTQLPLQAYVLRTFPQDSAFVRIFFDPESSLYNKLEGSLPTDLRNFLLVKGINGLEEERKSSIYLRQCLACVSQDRYPVLRAYALTRLVAAMWPGQRADSATDKDWPAAFASALKTVNALDEINPSIVRIYAECPQIWQLDKAKAERILTAGSLEAAGDTSEAAVWALKDLLGDKYPEVRPILQIEGAKVIPDINSGPNPYR